MKTKWIMGALLVLTVLAGCTTTTAELTSTTDNMETWTVDAPLEATFKAYKRYADEKLTPTWLLGDHIAAIAHYYGDDAEITIRHEGNPLARVTYLYLELKAMDKKTLVKGWYYNSNCKDNLDSLRKLEVTADK